jgi:inner membrane protein
MSGVGRAQGEPADRVRREAGIDPVCHTLVGAGLARSGLGKRTALGTATLLIGANLPDLDVLATLDGPAADLSFRRGWTHGILALAVLPILLTGGMLLFDHTIRRVSRSSLPSGVLPRQVLILSFISILSHPILDTLNTYGVRWLMPFSGRWFYGDTLFIVDPWMWLVLGAGVALSRRRGGMREHVAVGGRPARLALTVAAAYVLAMAAAAVAARRIAARELVALTGAPVEALMVGPMAVTPLVRRVVASQAGSYRVTTFYWLRRPHLDRAALRTYPRGRQETPAVAAAAATPLGRRFLTWARFPVFSVESVGRSTLVHIVDLRYADRPGTGFGAVTISLAHPPASAPSPGTPPASSSAGPAAPSP